MISEPLIQITKLDARGKAARWQGYAARLGFGMTRNRNQASARAPEQNQVKRNHQLAVHLAKNFMRTKTVRSNDPGGNDSELRYSVTQVLIWSG